MWQVRQPAPTLPQPGRTARRSGPARTKGGSRGTKAPHRREPTRSAPRGIQVGWAGTGGVSQNMVWPRDMYARKTGLSKMRMARLQLDVKRTHGSQAQQRPNSRTLLGIPADTRPPPPGVNLNLPFSPLFLWVNAHHVSTRLLSREHRLVRAGVGGRLWRGRPPLPE